MKSERILSLLLVLCLLLCLAPCAALAEGTIAETEAVEPGNETQALDNGYYVIGRNGWTVESLTKEDKLERNWSADGEEYELRTTLLEGQSFKVVLVSGGSIAQWFPDPGDNYVVDADHAGEMVVYFRPVYQSVWGGYIWVAEQEKYHITLQQPEHATLSVDREDAPYGATVTLTVDLEDGYALSQFKPFTVYFASIGGDRYTFSMPNGDVTISAMVYAGAGYYFTAGKNVAYLTPAERFREETSAYGEYCYDVQLQEGDSLSLVRITTDGSWSWDASKQDPAATAEQAGHVRVILSETDWDGSETTEREGYTKMFSISHWNHGTRYYDFETWMILKSFRPIVIESAQGGAVTADLTEAIEGQTVTLTATPEEGYELESLTVADAEGNAIAVEENAFLMPDSPVTVTAAFKPEQEPTVALSFNAGEGAVDPAAKEVTVGEAVGELPVPTREGGWVFMGWYTEAADSAFTAGQGTQVTAETVLEDDTTVYAHWRLPGDINGDGKVNNKDWNLLLRYVKYSEGTVVEINVDVTGDGKVNNKDWNLLLKYVKYGGVTIH